MRESLRLDEPAPLQKMVVGVQEPGRRMPGTEPAAGLLCRAFRSDCMSWWMMSRPTPLATLLQPPVLSPESRAIDIYGDVPPYINLAGFAIRSAPHLVLLGLPPQPLVHTHVRPVGRCAPVGGQASPDRTSCFPTTWWRRDLHRGVPPQTSSPNRCYGAQSITLFIGFKTNISMIANVWCSWRL